MLRRAWQSSGKLSGGHCQGRNTSSWLPWTQRRWISDYFVLSEEVSEGINSKKPVVALESTIITHGMPYPHNLSTAKEVEEVIRNNGAIPATVAILNGRIHVGLTEPELEELASSTTPAVKTSRRDLPHVISQKLNGGTTVSGTMIAANKVGIPIFVTGGIGGVHRGAESSMDISADLTELGRTPVAVVSAGVKSILDIGRTLEYLETQGVGVFSYGPTKDFPAFFTPKSGFDAPYNVRTPMQAAQIIDSSLSLGLGSGLLFGVPIPSDLAASGEEITQAIQQAVEEARQKNVAGKLVTPYILQRVNELTKGESLKSNIALVKNNADIGSKIACELTKLRSDDSSSDQNASGAVGGGEKKWTISQSRTLLESIKTGRPVVIGGSNVDFVTTMKTEHYTSNGATYPGEVRQSYGGVGRNIADCMSRLGHPPLFISAVGKDMHAGLLLKHCSSHMDLSGIQQLDDISTATYCAVLESTGRLLYGIGDMKIHDRITKGMIAKHEDAISQASVVALDGNIPADSIKYVIDLCNETKVPVWYDCTDILKACKPFLSDAWKKLTYIRPNLKELEMMHSYATGKPKDPLLLKTVTNCQEKIDVILSLCQTLVNYIPNIITTMGKDGVMVCRNKKAEVPFPIRGRPIMESNGMSAVYYQPCTPDQRPSNIASVSGAGDCLNAAMLCGIIQNHAPDICIKMGLKAANHTLTDVNPVPETLNPGDFSPAKIERWAPWMAVHHRLVDQGYSISFD
ncbi:uncharacterized protein LOC135503064 [Lineus longissimus]|uniref:uncharacterized protein LOC135503064 n=1 Tax=Lineus longissimus TaxID=88925 RepID=UPI00315D539B